MFHSTTIISIRHKNDVVIAGDGQVSLNNTIMKSKAKKVRRMFDDQVIAGFAGATADAFTLFERLEGKLKSFNGNLMRSAVELAKDWRSDKYLRRLEAMLLVSDKKNSLLLSGTGDIIEGDTGILAIGSGGPYAQAAAQALIEHKPELSAKEIASTSLRIAADICIYTNENQTIEELKEG